MPVPFQVGDILIGQDRYTITRLLSDKGGYGFTYEINDSQRNQKVAKVRREMSELQNPTPAEFQVCQRTFELEFDVMGQFNHPQIPKVFERFTHQGRRVMTMEFVQGTDLKDYTDDRARRGNPLSIQEAVEITTDLLGVLEYVHGFGYTHRDLKPENVMRTQQGQCALLDFGAIARPRLGQTRRTTAAPYTMFYGSPQVIVGTTPSEPRDDIFSVGMILEELITGASPAPTSNPDGGIITVGGQQINTPKLQHGQIVDQQGSAIDPALETIIFKARRMERVNRWDSATEMRQALENWLRPAPLVPAIRVSSNVHVFGQVRVSQTARWQFVIENYGNGTLNVSSITSNNTVFTVRPSQATIGPSGQTSVAVECRPVGSGQTSGVIEIQSNDSSSPIVRVNVQGEGTAPEISISPLHVDCGQIELGSAVTRKFQAKNVGSAPLTVSSIRIMAHDVGVIGPRLPIAINPGPDTDVEIQFAPTQLGRRGGTLTVFSDDAANPTVDIQVTGEGIAPQPPQITTVIPSAGYMGQNLTVRIFGSHIPMDPSALVVDMGAWVTITNIKPVTAQILEVTVDIATAIPTVSGYTTRQNDVQVLNIPAGLASNKLEKVFTITQSPPRGPEIRQLNSGKLYSGANAAFSLVGTTFQKDGQNIPAVSCTAPGVQFSDLVLGGSSSLSGTIRIPASCAPGTYDIVITNPDGKAAVGHGLLVVEIPSSGKRVCPHCHRETDASKDRCELCLLHKNAPIRNARG